MCKVKISEKHICALTMRARVGFDASRLGNALADSEGVVLQDIGGVHNAMPVAVPALEHLKVNYRTHLGIMNVSSLDDRMCTAQQQPGV